MFRALLAGIIRSTITVYAASGTSLIKTVVPYSVLVPEAAYTVVLLMMGARSARNM
jgi:hypothetical protein